MGGTVQREVTQGAWGRQATRRRKTAASMQSRRASPSHSVEVEWCDFGLARGAFSCQEHWGPAIFILTESTGTGKSAAGSEK